MMSIEALKTMLFYVDTMPRTPFTVRSDKPKMTSEFWSKPTNQGRRR